MGYSPWGRRVGRDLAAEPKHPEWQRASPGTRALLLHPTGRAGQPR